ncbi:cation transporter [Nocardia yamanashiensis]|uniref:heavy-metal-associated domain-containing protein n=1 Tax=Nocardia yamanashiensis TaxID=209247 RepID=UPI001E591906|nr:cation transporter [Nocardia yamanashiensis]UGT44002.1 cation transporter [Nocardia yamanashiensis]
MITYIFDIDGMHCGSCALLIDDALADLAGVLDSTTSVKKRRCTVEADSERVAPEDIVAAVKGLGYTATVRT